VISRDDADKVLTNLGAAHDRIAAAMYALDTHPGLNLLRRGNVSGRTDTVSRALRPEIDRLWARFGALNDVLEEARAMRARPRHGDADWAEMARLLREPVVPLDADGMPAEATAVPASRMSVDELTQQLERGCSQVLTQLSEMDAAWTAVASAFVPLSGSVDAVVTLAGQVGEPRTGERLRTALAEAERAGLEDPLATAPAGRLTDAAQRRLADLDRAAAQARRELDELVRLRDGYPQRRAALVTLVDEIATAEQAVAQTHARVAEKIADPGLGSVPGAATALRGRLGALDGKADRAEWRSLLSLMSTVEASAGTARERAHEMISVAEGLLARRTELRGRLEAYRAKAASRGLAEHDDLSTVYTRAHDLLFTAPCDLRASTRAVHAYQHALASVLAGRESKPLIASGEGSAADD